MVSGVAWLSICRRIHPKPIMIYLSEPGDEFDKDVHECNNYDEYCGKKGDILKLQSDELERGLKLYRRKERTARANSRQPTDKDEATSAESFEDDFPDNEIFKERKSLIKTLIWPSIQIYSPINRDQAGGQSGITAYAVQKSQVAAHWVVPQSNRASIVSIKEWVKLA